MDLEFEVMNLKFSYGVCVHLILLMLGEEENVKINFSLDHFTFKLLLILFPTFQLYCPDLSESHQPPDIPLFSKFPLLVTVYFSYASETPCPLFPRTPPHACYFHTH